MSLRLCGGGPLELIPSSCPVLEAKRRCPLALYVTTSYDAAGRAVSLIDQNLWVKTHTYDAIGRLVGLPPENEDAVR
mgnify:CR=1 FL=1